MAPATKAKKAMKAMPANNKKTAKSTAAPAKTKVLTKNAQTHSAVNPPKTIKANATKAQNQSKATAAFCFKIS